MSQIFSNISSGGAFPGGTVGSVLFVGPGPVISQDNANFFWDDTNNRLGIGTNAPNNSLQVTNLINFDNTDFTTRIGYQAGNNLAVGAQFNTFVGYQAGLSGAASGADQNTGVGYAALYSNTTGAVNTAVGFSALISNTAGIANTAVGAQALYINNIGTANSAFGNIALRDNSTGTNNVAVGYAALKVNTTASENVAVGYQALVNNTTGIRNVAVGHNAAFSASTVNFNTAVGWDALLSNIASGNTAVGYGAVFSNSTGTGITAIGYSALWNNTTGDFNTATGYNALYTNTTGYSNTAAGFQSLLSNTTGYQNTACGAYSMLLNSTGNTNTAYGYAALYNNTSGISNVAVGLLSLYGNTTGNNNTAVGNSSLVSNTTGIENVAYGVNALRTNISGGGNIAIGFGALYTTTGSYNNTSGYLAGYAITTGNRNVLIGPATIADSFNQITTGSNNISIGNDVAVASATASNQLCIGNLIYGTALDGTGTTISTGKIGIGTKAPSEKLSVTGNATVSSQFAVGTTISPIATAVISGTIATPGAGGISYGARVLNTFTYSANIDLATGIDVFNTLAVGAFTGTTYTGISVENPTVSSGTLDSSYGVYIYALTRGSYSNYGLFVDTPSGGSAANVCAYFASTVGIGTLTPNANALLDITSTTKAFMPPRMTTAQKNAIASPTAGMQVYDSTLNEICIYNGTSWRTLSQHDGRIVFSIGDGTNVITTGAKKCVEVTQAGVITGWKILSDDASTTAGAVVFDIWKDVFANYPPTVADTIINTGAGGVKPTVTASATNAASVNVNNWTTAVAAGDILRFNVDSVSTFTSLTLILEITYI